MKKAILISLTLITLTGATAKVIYSHTNYGREYQIEQAETKIEEVTTKYMQLRGESGDATEEHLYSIFIAETEEQQNKIDSLKISILYNI
jgi:hypothetical protein